MKIVTSTQMRLIEERCEASGVSTDTLMERAGLAVARRVLHHLGHLAGVHVLVLVGRGNNGADGLVAAAHLRRWGAECDGLRLPGPSQRPIPGWTALEIAASSSSTPPPTTRSRRCTAPSILPTR